MTHRLPILAALAAVSFAAPTLGQEVRSYAKSPTYQDTAAKKDERMRWFRDARFGMFIHWGLYSQLAGEWQVFSQIRFLS